MAGQEYRPIAGFRRTGGNPVFIAGSFSLTDQKTDKQANNNVCSLFLCSNTALWRNR
jgi:hypothetical protein